MKELEKYFYSNNIEGAKEFLDSTYESFRHFLFYLNEKSSLDKYESEFLSMLESSDLKLKTEERDKLTNLKIRKYLKVK